MAIDLSRPAAGPFSGLTEGRMVHYVTGPRDHEPAVVQRVVDRAAGVCSLSVFGGEDNPIRFEPGVPYNEAHAVGSWHWMERVE